MTNCLKMNLSRALGGFLLVLALIHVSSADIDMEPRFVNAVENETVSILCNVDGPLTGCKFRELYQKDFIDLSQGKSSPGTFEHHYLGDGLEQGDCGIRLTHHQNNDGRGHLGEIILCYVQRQGSSEWEHEHMIIYTEEPEIEVNIKPDVAYVKLNGTVKIHCDVEEPILDCQFIDFESGQIFDLEDNEKVPDQDDNYEYIGDGYDEGDCAIELGYNNEEGSRIIGCRVRINSTTSEWDYDETLIVVLSNNAKTDPLYKFTTEEVIAKEDDDVTILGKTNQPLSKCKFEVPGEDDTIDFSEGKKQKSGNYEYFGEGLNKGECGIKINDVKKSGFVISHIELKSSKLVASDFMTLIVADAPEDPELTLKRKTLSNDGVEVDILHAECRVEEGSPVANITWYLGDEEIREDHEDDESYDKSMKTDDWWWSYEPETIMQILEISIRDTDEDKWVRCIASHFALPEGKLEAKIKIDDEPEEPESSGAGVLYTVLIILLVVVLIVVIYSYLTQKLCFSDNFRQRVSGGGVPLSSA